MGHTLVFTASHDQVSTEYRKHDCSRGKSFRARARLIEGFRAQSDSWASRTALALKPRQGPAKGPLGLRIGLKIFKFFPPSLFAISIALLLSIYNTPGWLASLQKLFLLIMNQNSRKTNVSSLLSKSGRRPKELYHREQLQGNLGLGAAL